MTKNQLFIYIHTDGDFWFESPNRDYPFLDYDPPFDYENYRLKDEDLAICFKYNDPKDPIQFLRNMVEDLTYSCSHDWALEEFSEMVSPIIEFLESDEYGVRESTLKDGNWQPTIIRCQKEKPDPK